MTVQGGGWYDSPNATKMGRFVPSGPGRRSWRPPLNWTTPPEPVSGDLTTDRAALVAFYNATGGPHWRNNSNWLSEAPIGEWQGITIDARGHATVPVLDDSQSTGQVPPESGDLTGLTRLSRRSRAT